MLDPILAPALALAERPVLHDRKDMDREAHNLVATLERVAKRAEREGNLEAQAQLLHVAEALGVCVISLTAYCRGVVPKVATRPNPTLIVS